MTRKGLSLIGVILFLLAMQSCSSPPEEITLKKWFHAQVMGDKTTLSTMALEPVQMDAESWEIISAAEEVVEPCQLPELNKRELELKKKVEESIIITVEAKEDLDDAEFELDRARTGRAKRAAQTKVNELKARYEEIRKNHDQVQSDYSLAKSGSAREESITSFSLGAGDLPNMRELTGDVHSKEVEVKVEGQSGTKNYKFYLRMYNLRDETLNLHRRGRWIIVKIETIS